MNTRELGIITYPETEAISTKKGRQNAPISIAKLLKLWQSRSYQRRELARRTPEQLEDMGLSQEMVAVEISKPFWKA